MLAVISMLVMTLGEMLAIPFMNSFMISRTDTGNRGQYAGLYTAAWSIAQVLGPFSGTQMAEHLGYTVLWWVISGVGIITALGFRWMQYRIALSK